MGWEFAVVALLVSQPEPAPAPVPAPAPAHEQCKIVVLNLVGKALPAEDVDLPAMITDTLAGEVGAVSGCSVVSQADILAMLAYEKQKAICTDGSDSCLAEVGQALGAERVVAGTVGKIGAEYIISARLMNVKQGGVEQRTEAPVGVRPELLRHGAKNAARRLFGLAELPAPEIAVPIVVKPMEPDEGLPALFWIGGVAAGVGVAAAVAGAGFTFLAEDRLSEPEERNKDSAVSDGRVGLSVAAVGGVLLVAGGVCIGVSLLE